MVALHNIQHLLECYILSSDRHHADILMPSSSTSASRPPLAVLLRRAPRWGCRPTSRRRSPGRPRRGLRCRPSRGRHRARPVRAGPTSPPPPQAPAPPRPTLPAPEPRVRRRLSSRVPRPPTMARPVPPLPRSPRTPLRTAQRVSQAAAAAAQAHRTHLHRVDRPGRARPHRTRRRRTPRRTPGSSLRLPDERAGCAVSLQF